MNKLGFRRASLHNLPRQCNLSQHSCRNNDRRPFQFLLRKLLHWWQVCRLKVMMNIEENIKTYIRSRSSCIPLVASENVMSQSVRALCSSEIAERYCVGSEAPWKYPRETLLEDMLIEVRQLACAIFGGKQSTVAPLSGSQCVAAIMLGLCRPGDLVVGLSPADGGHWALRGMADAQQCVFEPLPISEDGKIDTGNLAGIIRRKRPTLVMVDPSHSLAAFEPEKIRSVLPQEIPLFYDISHFMGIVPHQYLIDPFKRGVTALHGSTHKSLFGPQKGLIVFGQTADDPLINKILFAAEKVLTSNCHLHHVAALGACLKEYQEFGECYASAVVKYARIFARSLAERELDVMATDHVYTNSHQVLIKLPKDAAAHWSRLTNAGILCNLVRPPREQLLGIRFGLAEVTRRGYTESEIEKIAQLVAGIVIDIDDSKHLHAEVKELASQSRRMKFCFE